MRDISGKPTTYRTARAEAVLRAHPATIDHVRYGTVPKGNALELARAAGILAAKQTPHLIPLCHPIPLSHADVAFEIRSDAIAITGSASAVWATGVEMEALTAASVAALTLYDMLKPLDDDLEIVHVRLIEKHGGTSDRPAPAGSVRAAVIVVSDRVSAGLREDGSGAAIVEILGAHAVAAPTPTVIPDERETIERTLRSMCDGRAWDLVLTTGGTGVGPRDVTVEATRGVIEREVPGIAEAARAFGQDREPRAMFSRAIAGIRGRTLIVNLPGSPRGVRESLSALLPEILHVTAMIAGEGHPE